MEKKMAVEAHDFEWFLSHEKAYESLTVEQVHALGRGELVEYGETAPAEEVSPAAAESVESPADATPPAEPKVDDEPVVLTKDGKHTIPFSELEAARAKADQLEALSKEQSELI